jgi:hypothetical protein
MQSPSVLKKHAALFDRMAQTLGLDLEESAMRGDLTIDQISDAVLACTGCSDPDHCDGWLQERATGAGDPPGFCRNSDLLLRLQPEFAV